VTPQEIGRQFCRLIIEAVHAPATVNRNQLLKLASAYLDVAQAGEPNSLALSRTMAFRACDWAVFGHPDDYARLTRAASAFRMCSRIKDLV
jgi:hypothetical protein